MLVTEMSLFNSVYELGEKMLFDNPLEKPCETCGDDAINAFLDDGG
jgi:hypothetical protein